MVVSDQTFYDLIQIQIARLMIVDRLSAIVGVVGWRDCEGFAVACVLSVSAFAEGVLWVARVAARGCALVVV